VFGFQSLHKRKVAYFYSKANQMHPSIKFILFWNNTLHVSDGLSVHHQQFETVHTATGICQTDVTASGNEMELSCRALFQNKKKIER